MVRSRLSVASLLGLFGAVLMLFPELLLGSPEVPSDLAATDPPLHKALAFTVEKYNQVKEDSNNYFKMSRFAKKGFVKNFSFMMEFAETTCKKKPGSKMAYNNIQKCQELPGKSKKIICYIRVLRAPLLHIMHMDVPFCL